MFCRWVAAQTFRLVTPESGMWINMFASFHIWSRPRQKRETKKMHNFEKQDSDNCQLTNTPSLSEGEQYQKLFQCFVLAATMSFCADKRGRQSVQTEKFKGYPCCRPFSRGNPMKTSLAFLTSRYSDFHGQVTRGVAKRRATSLPRKGEGTFSSLSLGP